MQQSIVCVGLAGRLASLILEAIPRLFWLLCAFTACRATLAADVPIEDFFKRSEFLQLSLSPNGRKVAALVPVGGRFNLAVLELVDRKNIRVITRETSGDVIRFWWVNDNRLVFTLGDMIEQPGLQRDGGGLIAINVDGTEARVLTPTVATQARQGAFALRGATYLSSISTPGDPTDEILVLSNDRSEKYPDVYRLNTKTRDKTLLTFDSPGNVVRWVVDHDHVVRGAVGFDEKETFAGYYRESANAPWRKLSEFKRDAAGFVPIAFDGDNKTLLVASGVRRDKNAIFKLDMQTGKVGELIVGHDAVDVSGGLIYDRLKKQHVGVRINAYKPETHWFDAEWAAVQKTVDTALPDTINTLMQRDGGKIFLVTSQSDTQPAFWSMLDMEKRTLERLASSREWIKPEQMSEMRAFRFVARDGLEIPAYLTVPRSSGGKNLPLIVNPHGGPWSRDSWGFNPEVQFFAARGFAVLQPNFRMSTGFGGKHFRAGFRQWGLAMQDDITDAVQWAIKEGVADPERICIYGASYGGYAALMGIIKTPELYKCAINYVGVTNLEELFDNRFWNRSVLDYTLPQRLGHPERDREMLRANSPINLVDKINRPLFMAYGGLDRNVLPAQGQQLARALDRADKKYEWMYKPDEAHGYFSVENRVELYSKMEAFLRQHLGPITQGSR